MSIMNIRKKFADGGTDPKGDFIKSKILSGSNKYQYLKDLNKKYGYNLADAFDTLYRFEVEHPKNLSIDPNYTISSIPAEQWFKRRFSDLEEAGIAAQQHPEQEKYMLDYGYDSILKHYGLLDSTTEIPTIDPFSGQPTSKQDVMDILEQLKPPTPEAGWTEEGLIKNAEDAAAREKSMMEAFNFSNNENIFPQQESTGLNYLTGIPDSYSASVSQLGREGILDLLTSNFSNLDLQTMNELRNNPEAFTIENPYLQAGRTAAQLLSPGKVISDVGEGLSTIYHGTADPSKAFMGSKFFATPDYQTALQYAKEGALRGTQFGDATGDVLRATAPTSQIQDLLKRGLTGTREIVLDPQMAQKLFLQGSGNLVETGSLASKLGKKAFQALPAVGSGLAALDAYQRYNQGDYIGAGLGAASAVPVAGLPATAAQILYDIVYKPTQRN